MGFRLYPASKFFILQCGKYYTILTHLNVIIFELKMGADHHNIEEVDEVCKKVVSDEPNVAIGVDVKGKSKWYANCIVENAQAHETRPEVEKISLKVKE